MHYIATADLRKNAEKRKFFEAALAGEAGFRTSQREYLLINQLLSGIQTKKPRYISQADSKEFFWLFFENGTKLHCGCHFPQGKK